jgi:hypothetical protein
VRCIKIDIAADIRAKARKKKSKEAEMECDRPVNTET